MFFNFTMKCYSLNQNRGRCSNLAADGCFVCSTHARFLIRGGAYAPEKYLAGLTSVERKKRLSEIKKGAKTKTTDPGAYNKKNFSTDFEKDGSRKKTKPSQYTKAFYDLYPNAKSLKQKARVTGVPEDILQKVYDRGMAAWRTGHRPGATQEQWGYARVHSFLMKGCTYYFPDHKLVEEAERKSKKARTYWKNLDCMCPKRCTD